MAYGKYPRYDGSSTVETVLSDPDVLREFPILKGVKIPFLYGKVFIYSVFNRENLRILQGLLKITECEALELKERFWGLFCIDDLKDPNHPRAAEEELLYTELVSLKHDLQQEALFGVFIPPEELTKKKERARELHNAIRALKGKPPKAAKEE